MMTQHKLTPHITKVTTMKSISMLQTIYILNYLDADIIITLRTNRTTKTHRYRPSLSLSPLQSLSKGDYHNSTYIYLIIHDGVFDEASR